VSGVVTLPAPSFGSLDVVVQSVTNQTNVRMHISNSYKTFGVWLQSGASISFKDSWLLLFPTFTQSTLDSPVTGLYYCEMSSNNCVFTNKDFALSTGDAAVNVQLQNTQVYLWNAYFQGGVAHKLTNSIVGETNCEDDNTVCYFDNVLVDGRGGMLTSQDKSKSFYTASNITTSVFADDSSVITFTNCTFGTNSDLAELVISLSGSGTVVVQNSHIPLGSNAASGYTLIQSGTGSMVEASITSPIDGTLLPCESFSVQLEAQVFPPVAGSTYSLSTSADGTVISVAASATSNLPFVGVLPGSTITPSQNGTLIITLTTVSGTGISNAVASRTVTIYGCRNGAERAHVLTGLLATLFVFLSCVL